MNKEDLDNIIKHYQDDISTIRTNRATPMLIESIKVEAYGSLMPLNQLAAISAPESSQLLIQPFDQAVIKDIEKALLESDLGLTPTNEGKQLRISIPPLTEERRNEFIKLVNQKAENARVSVRQKRDEAMKLVRQQEKAGTISEDDRFGEEKSIQELVDNATKEINNLAQEKELDLKTI
jgi:ribosome recycling factor